VTQTSGVYLVVLADAHKRGEAGKVDLYGIFSTLRVWGVPTQRECSIAIGLKDVTPGVISLTMWLRKHGRKAAQVGNAQLQIRKTDGNDEGRTCLVVAERIAIPIADVGDFEIGVSVGQQIRGGRAYWCPVVFDKLPWPILPEGVALERALRRPEVLKSVRAHVVCNKCKTEYVFQINLDPAAERDEGVRNFPKSGVFTCGKCKTKHHLRDIEGQALAQLAESANSGGK
jgi:hypothetical protein